MFKHLIFKSVILAACAFLIGLLCISILPDIPSLFLFCCLNVWGLFQITTYLYQMRETLLDTDIQLNKVMNRLNEIEKELQFFQNFYEGFNLHLIRFEEHVKNHGDDLSTTPSNIKKQENITIK